MRAAAADGAELVALPEKWNLLAEGEELLAGAEPLDGPSLSAARGWARELGIHLLAGSVCEAEPGPTGRKARYVSANRPIGDRAFNTSVLIGPDGDDLATYRKIHMFDVDVGGVSYRESEHEEPGEEIVAAALGDLSGDLTLGLSVCYDLRFPELYRILALRGARVLAVPSAFTTATGRDHWEVLLRARAIENQAFVLAPNQVGEAPPHFSSYGHSAIVDPWGAMLATAPERGGLRRRRPRPRRAGACARVAPLARQPPPARLRLAPTDGGARLMAKATAPGGRQAPPDPRRGDPRLRPPGLPLDPRLRHRRRGRRRLRARLPLLQVEGRGPQRALHASAGRCCSPRSRRPTARMPRRASSSRPLPASSSTPTATTRS